MILDSIKQSIGKYGFLLSEQGQYVYCPHVNGLTAYCLAQIGETDLARNGLRAFQSSNAFSQERNIFHKFLGTANEIVDETFNYCKNSIAGLGFASVGDVTFAKRILGGINSSALKREGSLYNREFSQNEVNQNVYPQSHFWHILALVELRQDTNNLFEDLEAYRQNDMFVSSDCRITKNAKSRIYLDDQALYIWAKVQTGDKKSAQTHANTLLSLDDFCNHETGLFRSFISETELPEAYSTYKNSLLAIALSKIGMKDKASQIVSSIETCLSSEDGSYLVETNTHSRFAPDNNALFLYAKHLIQT